MKDLLQDEFDIIIQDIERMHGYDNANFLVKTTKHPYTFKSYQYDERALDWIKAENESLLFLQHSDSSKYPKPVEYADGSYVKTLDLNGKKHICRMLSFLEGDFLGAIEHTNSLFESFGVFLAEMDLSLQHYSNPILATKVWAWDIQHLLLNEQYIEDIPKASDRAIIRYFFLQYKELVFPRMYQLRKQVIHNDANEWNVLTKNGKVTGIIDFGDIAYSYLINELAVAITYACYDKESPLEWAMILLRAYQDKLPLLESEIEVLYYLIAARLCMSVCHSAHAKKQDPENTYATSSEKKAWAMLDRWLRIGPIAAEKAFRKATGWAPKKPPILSELIKRRHQHMSPILSLSYQEPIHMVGSAFQYMYDAHGICFLDAYNNIPHVGHAHPQVVEAGQRQMARLNTNTRYLYDQLMEYAEKLIATFPAALNQVYFVNSGSAAADLAIRMAKAHTQHQQVMVMEHGYHGHTQTSLDISHYKFNHPKGQGRKADVLITAIPDTYRGKYRHNDGRAGKLYAQDAITQILHSAAPIAAFISEPIVGCGGQVPLAKGYLKEVYPAIRHQGGLCISDEVQTGFGRTGDHFWGFEAQQVVPDIVIVGKPMANGHPMGAVICTAEIADSFGKGVEFFSSFGGNPVSCAIASSVLDVIEAEQLQANAKVVGDDYENAFIGLQKTYSCIGDVRGSGLFLGVELIKGNNQTPDTALAQYLKNKLRNHQILVSTDGPFNNVIKTKPPMCFTKENARSVVRQIKQILQVYDRNV